MTASSATTPGTLYVVATPIGNRDDISVHALHVLQAVDAILAEDTRHSQPLLATLGIKKPLISMHAHNETKKCEGIVAELLAGRTFALISDAGTPLISDPGFPLVRLAREKQIAVVPIPGACALIAALSAAGVPCDTFTFAGFLPAKQTARLARLAALSKLTHTLVFYESTHRIKDSVADLMQVLGASCELVLAKELTKTFETFVTGSCEQILRWLTENPAHCKGEFVLIVPPRATIENMEVQHHVLRILLAELPLKQAVKLACEITNGNKNELYKIALQWSRTP
ncbi:16S rRNA (cytidine(1402)-2'-O)-methyltransferase [Legionella septentrionalis]|uniref:16S rRNA (cytidine(1402)-2'-O)-methyltransferase n=1 Tax=Legionella septentrionalis TaxID=2498109 RepID=UPI000F8D28B7|nr:16S rRNA (cytidine(1402)-2'-O)-methyltransferase [Legionella septentrionalis]RUR02907.1 16S rRNA (cytidine(1402)-2'-O)-methyltransferase [Legionella septentrionalis]